MGKKAFLVLGPESSGTRFVTSLFILAGCYGDAGHEQRLDNEIPDVETLVWRRSLPHNKVWVDPQALFLKLYDVGVYQIYPVVCVRDWFCIAESQLKNGYALTRGDAFRNIEQAYNMTYYDLSPVMFVYEAAMLYGRAYIDMFMSPLGLTIPLGVSVDIRNGDDKYYGL